MEEGKSFKQQADEVMLIKGHSKGEIIRDHANYIKARQGEDGLKAVEDKMKEIGYPVTFSEIKPFDWYPEALSVLVIMTAKEVFNWSEQDIIAMGKSAPRQSLIIKFLIKQFVSLEKALEVSSVYWDKHYDFGRIEASEVNEKEKYCILKVVGYKFHPVVCVYWRGYFSEVASFVISRENITIEENACAFKGSDFHEFIIRWR
jgi:hypothetical protein